MSGNKPEYRCVNHGAELWFPATISFEQQGSYLDTLSFANRWVSGKHFASFTDPVPSSESGNKSTLPRISLYKFNSNGQYLRMRVSCSRAENQGKYVLEETSDILTVDDFNRIFERRPARRTSQSPSDLFAERRVFTPGETSSNCRITKFTMHNQAGSSFTPVSPSNKKMRASLGILADKTKSLQGQPSEPRTRAVSICRRSTSDDSEDELRRAASSSSENSGVVSGSPVLALSSALKGRSPASERRRASPRDEHGRLIVRFEVPSPVVQFPLARIPEEIDGDHSPLTTNNTSSEVTSSFRLACAACKTALGAFGMMVLFLGCIGLAIATYGTTLFYGSSAMVTIGAAAFGISLFHTSRSQAAAPASGACGVRDEKAAIRQQIW